MGAFLTLADANTGGNVQINVQGPLMKLTQKVIFISLLALCFAWNCHAQTWTYVQESLSSANCVGSSQCSTFGAGDVVPTTAGTVRVMVVDTDCTSSGNCSNGHISSVTGGGASWTVCPNCYITVGGEQKDMAYSITCPTTANCGVGGGFANFSITLTGASVGMFRFWLYEFMPPSASVASFDTSTSTGSSSVSCPGNPGVCTAIGLGPRPATDIIIQDRLGNGPGPWNGWSSPYFQSMFRDGFVLNDSTGVAPTMTQGVANGTAGFGAIAFKSSAGIFTPPTAHMKAVNYVNYGKNTSPSNLVTCSPSCSITIPATSAGNLLYLEAGDQSSTLIQSVSDSAGDNWQVPSTTGTSTCRNTMSGGYALSCAYVLSTATAGVTHLNITMTGSSSVSFAVMEIQPLGGVFSLDVQGSTVNSASLTPFGKSLSLAKGADDVIFQTAFIPGGTTGVSYYPIPQSSPSLGPQFFENQAGFATLLDATTGVVPVWGDQQNNQTLVTGVAFKISSGTATAPNPPTGLTAVVN